jgi:hypothetical protein
MSRYNPITRRTVLRGLGTAMALPWLEAMGPVTGKALGALEQAHATPRRMAFLYVPNGAHMPAWTPTAQGSEFELPEILKPLNSYKKDILVLTGLTQENADAKGDGGGDHARALACFLTGVHPRKTDGANIKAGVSVDQVAARSIGDKTRFSSLELGIDPSAQAGNCDSGYSCAYSSNISWSSESTPVAHETNPRAVFDRLFGGGNASEASASVQRRTQLRQSILDLVNEDARRLRERLGSTDARKLDEYLSGVRELERRIAQSMLPPPNVPEGGQRPSGVPAEYSDHIRLMCDMIALAFQADLTRVVTFVLANEGSNRSYRSLDVPEGHHELSHHEGNAEKQAKIAKINTFHMEQFAYLLEKLKSASEGDGSLLDNSMVVYGSGIGDGNRHNHNDLPIVLAGKCSGTIQTGRHVSYPRDTPLNNLFLSMLERIECRVDELGDSTGALPGLAG